MAQRRQASYADVLAAPEHQVAEVIDGELFLSPRPAGPHTLAASRLGGQLDNPFGLGRGGPGGWIILDEPELHHGPQILVPDLAGWRRERLSAIPTDVPYFVTPPDWVCEVLSPSTARLDRFRKLPVYASHGIGHAWIVDPLARTLEVLRLHAGQWLIVLNAADDAVVRAEPFDAIELELGLLWLDQPRPTWDAEAAPAPA